MTRIKNYKIDVAHTNLVMRDHTVQGIAIMPGVTLIDVILKVISSAGLNIEEIVIKKMLFSNPIWTNNEFDRRLNVVLTKTDEVYQIVIQSRKLSKEKIEIEEPWVRNASADIYTKSKQEYPQNLNLETVEDGIIEEQDIDTIYAIARQMEIIHGPFMKTIGAIKIYEDKVIATIELSKEAMQARDRFIFPPALLDASTLPFSALINTRHASIVQDPFIPMFVSEFTYRRKPKHKIFVEVQKGEDKHQTEDILYNTIRIYDEEGVFIGSFEQLGAKRIRSTTYLQELIHRDIKNSFSKDLIKLSPKKRIIRKALSTITVEQSQIVTFLKDIIQEINSEITIEDTTTGFYELGLDSADLLKIVQTLEKHLTTELYPTLLFEYKNIEELAVYILEEHKENVSSIIENTTVKEEVIQVEAVKASKTINAIEAFIKKIIQEINTTITSVDTTTGFYELGLDSTDLLKVVQKLEEKLGVDLYPTLLFEYKNIAELAQYILEENMGEFKEITTVQEEEKIEENIELTQQNTDITCYTPTWESYESIKEIVSASDKIFYYIPRKIAEVALNKLKKANPEVHFVIEGDSVEYQDQSTTIVANDFLSFLAHLEKYSDIKELNIVIDGNAIEDSSILFKIQAICKALAEKEINEFTIVVYTASNPHIAIRSIEGYFKSAVQEFPKAKCIILEEENIDTTINSGIRSLWSKAKESIGSQKRGFYKRRITVDTDETAIYKKQELKLDNTQRNFKKGGRYLITGGAGAIGLALAKYLLKNYDAELCLISRREKDEKITNFINEARQTSGRVIYVKTDITQKQDVFNAVRRMRTAFKGIDGVFHCAGITRDNRIIHKTEEDVKLVLSPKIEGTQYLDEATKNEKLEVFMLFSSLSAVVGNMGQADYAYANAYLNAFTKERALKVIRGERSGKSIAIAWPFWKEGGLAPDKGLILQMEKTIGLRPLETKEGMQIIEAVLATNESVLAPIAGKLKAFKQYFREDKITAKKTKPQKVTVKTGEQEEIAIIGISGRFPQADTLNKFWDNLKQGKDSITEIPKERWNVEKFFDKEKGVDGKYYCKHGGFIDDHDKFDPLFFRISPQEAENMDPHERLFLQETWKAFEDAGYNTDRIAKVFQNEIGVFVGAMWNDYELIAIENLMQSNPVMATSSASSIANRTSFFLDLKGPSIPIDTMCSSSLMAIHLACQSIRDKECKGAIVGGVNLSLHPWKYIKLSRMQMLSPDGRCKTFGDQANGYVPGEGVVSLILKPLSQAIADNDQVYATIKGTGVNHTGLTSGLTVPSPKAQAEVIKTAIANAQIPEEEISYIEAHGTGTDLGDPIEISGLKMAYKKSVANKRFIGSVKSNIGHLEAAAGVAAVVKVCMQIKHNTLVPSLHSEVQNPKLGLSTTGFVIPRKTLNWKQNIALEKPLCAAVSSFGAGGTNVSVILQEAIKVSNHQELIENKVYTIPVSALTKKGLNNYINTLHAFFVQKEEAINLQQIENTFKFGRSPFKERTVFVFEDIQELINQLQKFEEGIYDPIEALKAKYPEEKEKIIDWLTGKIVQWDASKLKDLGTTSLPTYPFEQRKCWLPTRNSMFFETEIEEVVEETSQETPKISTTKTREEIEILIYQTIFNELKLTKEEVARDVPLTEMGMDSIMAMRMINYLEKNGVVISLSVMIEYPTIDQLLENIVTQEPELIEE